MNLSLTLQFTKDCKVFRATDSSHEGDQQVNVNFYPVEDGRTNVTLFAPTIETADALVDAIAACGAQKTTREDELGGGLLVSRTKRIPFADSLAIWAETADEAEIRDGAVMLGIYARQRKFAFRIRVEAAPVEKPLPLLDQEKK